MSPETKGGLDLVLSAINKKFGKGTAMVLTTETMPDRDNVIPSGSIALDTALGIGGYPKGRVVEIYGPPSAGKSTLCLSAIAECQKRGGVAAFIDAEAALDVIYAGSLGVDLEKLIIIQPFCGEDALNTANMLARSGEVDLIIVDSVAALVPRKELEGEMEDQSIGVQARMMSKALRMLVSTLNNSKCTLVFTNQTRMKIGVMYGNPEVTSGGNALAFYASVRMRVTRTGDVGKKDDVLGNETKVKITKNKMAAPKKEANFDIIFGTGIDKRKDLLSEAVKDGVIERAGAWYKYQGENIGQGMDNVLNYFTENPEQFEIVKRNVLEDRGLWTGGEEDDGREKTDTDTETSTEEEES
jgi:recombination protein RecA